MIVDDLDPELREFAARLQRERPLPRPAFRGDLGRRLTRRTARPAPRYLRLLVAGQLGAGALLLALAALGAYAEIVLRARAGRPAESGTSCSGVRAPRAGAPRKWSITRLRAMAINRAPGGARRSS